MEMEILQLPNVNDFRATFGASCDINDPLDQQYEFIDKQGKRLDVSFNLVAKTIGFSLFHNSKLELCVTLKLASRVLIDEKKQCFIVEFLPESDLESLNIVVWPDIIINLYSKL